MEDTGFSNILSVICLLNNLWKKENSNKSAPTSPKQCSWPVNHLCEWHLATTFRGS